MATRKSGPLDVMVGARIRVSGNRGMIQTMLAERIGATFQQVQKYERGTNWVGASQLLLIASVLGVSVGEFFESAEAGSSGLSSPTRLLAEPGALRALKACARTTNPRVRLCIANLIDSIADRTPGMKATVTRLNTDDRGKRRTFPSQG
ncbi:helix-turn-helix domain-containing protein [Bradyrhizobium archetypum]|uniref:Helix-turn-helix transcriptional regulator n=1 Tax=Bradyrhizobium archetypum TaxID=2721160 RepID=A0A7Y4H4C2_9BRAD|nr:helix-turn-helix transcriptional regulator [Bradyrhizobium archetypum]NOJ47074.1 helix-turn-helix transcriptional regulator [Bradyrhizobium archetypum]